MSLFRNKYRIESARLKGYDYAEAGAYFVTVCTKGMQCWFGDVVNGEMQLSAIGNIVADEWMKTERIRANVTLDAWVIMPNHLHGIVVINEPASSVETHGLETHGVETHSSASLRGQQHKQNRFGPQRHNLASIIRGFKAASTKHWL